MAKAHLSLTFIVFVVIFSLANGKTIIKRQKVKGTPLEHEISYDRGSLQCGKHKCPNPPFACDLSTSNKNKRKVVETIATCTGRDKKIRKFKDTARDLRRLNIDINIKTSGTIDDVKINIEAGGDTPVDPSIEVEPPEYSESSWGMPRGQPGSQRKPARTN